MGIAQIVIACLALFISILSFYFVVKVERILSSLAKIQSRKDSEPKPKKIIVPGKGFFSSPPKKKKPRYWKEEEIWQKEQEENKRRS